MARGKCLRRICGLFAAALTFASASGRANEPGPLANRISAMIDRTVEYPRHIGIQQDEEGVALVAFLVGQSGNAENAQIVGSSGYRDLDQAAIRSIKKLRGLPPSAAGRHVVAVLQFRVGGSGSDLVAAHNLATAVARLQKRWPDALVPTHNIRRGMEASRALKE